MSDTPEKTIPADEILVMLCADLEVDGRLSPDQRAALGAVLTRNPRLKELYGSFRFTRDPLARPFDVVLTAPLPDSLLRTVREIPSPRMRRSRPPRTSWAGKSWARKSWARKSWARKGRASLAWFAEVLHAPAFSPAVALPALAVSIAAGWLLHTATGAGANARDPLASAVAQYALEATPSDVAVDLAHGVRLKPRLTFARPDKAWCRQFTLSYPESLESGGVACRNEAGVWQVLMETGLTAAGPAPSASSHLPAGPPPSESEGILDSVRSQLKKGDVLGRQEEAERIAEHWARK
jgi:anti-sigma factor RsiW